MIKFQINKIALTLTALALFSCAILWNEKSRAATTGLTGKCGGVFSTRTSADGPLLNGEQETLTVSLILNFDTNKASVAATEQKMLSNAPDLWFQTMKLDKTMTVVNDPDGLDGSYEIVIKMENLDLFEPKMRLIPVNSGNTILIQGKNFGSNGVCQKI